MKILDLGAVKLTTAEVERYTEMCANVPALNKAIGGMNLEMLRKALAVEMKHGEKRMWVVARLVARLKVLVCRAMDDEVLG
jgi:hypothetical protein